MVAMKRKKRAQSVTHPPVLHLCITQWDIDMGLRHVADGCAAARAARRQFPDAVYVSVTRRTILVRHETRVSEYSVPDKLSDFIYQYDQSGRIAVKPMRVTSRRVRSTPCFPSRALTGHH